MSLADIRASFFNEVKNRIRTGSKEAIRCPCCETFHTVYHRTISSAVARDLIRFYRKNGLEYGHVTSIHDLGGGDFSKLALWGFVQPMPEEDAESRGGRTSGMWRVTESGELFLKGVINAVKVKLVYRGNHVGEYGERVTIHDCLKNKFDYKKLMGIE